MWIFMNPKLNSNGVIKFIKQVFLIKYQIILGLDSLDCTHSSFFVKAIL